MGGADPGRPLAGRKWWRPALMGTCSHGRPQTRPTCVWEPQVSGARWECGLRPGTASLPFRGAAACGCRRPAVGWKHWNPGQSLASWPLVGASISSSLGGWPQGLRWGLGAPREEAQGGPASWGLSGAARGVAALQRGCPAPRYLHPPQTRPRLSRPSQGSELRSETPGPHPERRLGVGCGSGGPGPRSPASQLRVLSERVERRTCLASDLTACSPPSCQVWRIMDRPGTW